jgi:Flp pilus assembly protein TadG
MATLNTRGMGSNRGQAVIELALTLPLLLLVVLGIFDFGFMFQRYEVVTNAAREGARVAVLPGYQLLDAENRALAYLDAAGMGGAGITTVACQAAGSRALSPNTRCVGGGTSTITLPALGTAPAKTVTVVAIVVEFDHEFGFVGPIMNLFGGNLGTTRLRAVSSMRKEP